MANPTGFRPPPYPYDRLDELKAKAEAIHGDVVDLSIGTPNDAPPPAVVAALASSDAERGYPPSIGTPELRSAASSWLQRRLGVDIDADQVAAAIGTKEFVASLPRYLHLRDPSRDTVLYPSISYPTYAMGATLAGLRPVAVPVDGNWCVDLTKIAEADAERALCLWINAPGNPAGGLDDLGAAAEWGRAREIPVFSDECYVEFAWASTGSTILEHGSDGVVAVHSVSKRSNMAGVRVGFYAGDGELVHYLREVRKHAGCMVPGPAQAAAVVALGDQGHVEDQRRRYRSRLERCIEILADVGVSAEMPGGGFYLFPEAPHRDAWRFVERLAIDGGVLVSPGEFYGDAGAERVRIALVHSTDQLDRVAARLELAH